MSQDTTTDRAFTAQDFEELGRALVEHAHGKVSSGALQPTQAVDGVDEYEVGPLTLRVRMRAPQGGTPPSPDAMPSGGGTCCVCVVDTGGVIVCRGWCCPGQPGGF